MAIHSVDAEAGSVLTQLPCESQLSLQRSPRCRSMSTLALAGGLALAPQSVAASRALPPSPEGDEGAEAATSSAQPSSFRTRATCDSTSDGWSLRDGAVAQRRERPARSEPTPRAAADASQERGSVAATDVEVATEPATAKLASGLQLPIPARNRSEGANHTWFAQPPASDEDATPLPPMLPTLVAVPPGLPTSSRKAISKAPRALPARLHQLDDQTVIPREVHNRMLQLGDTARGRLGYGQHRLVFVGSDGRAVLRREVAPATVLAH